MPISNFQTGEEAFGTPAVQPQAAPVRPLAAPENGVLYATDAKGRRIGVKKLSALDMFELSCLMGDQSGNSAAYAQAMLAMSVVEIGGAPAPRPTSMLTLKARIGVLDFDGFGAVSEALASAAPVKLNEDAAKN